MRQSVVLIAFALLIPFVAFSQSQNKSTDQQFRPLLHKQAIKDGDRFGLAGWWILPDATAKNNNFRSRVLGGLLYKQEKRWFEFLGGGLVHQKSLIVDPLANVRISERSIPKVNLFADVEYRFRNDTLYSLLVASTPVRIGNIKMGVGVESENITLKKGRDSLGVGPRIAIPLSRRVTLAVSYQFRNDRNFFRQYLAINF